MFDLSMSSSLSRAETVKSGNAVDWVKEARHLVGGGDSQSPRAATLLKAWAGPDAALREALKTSDRFLALDVITALGRKGLLEDLVAAGPSDATGFTYLAINTFITDRNLTRFATLYAQLLADPKTSPATRVILLDTLSRMNVRLDPRQLDDLLFDTSDPEVHSAAISFLRHTLKTHASPEDLQRLQKLMSMDSLSDQRKTQILFLRSELGKSEARDLKTAPWSCPPKIPTALQKFCARGVEP